MAYGSRKKRAAGRIAGVIVLLAVVAIIIATVASEQRAARPHRNHHASVPPPSSPVRPPSDARPALDQALQPPRPATWTDGVALALLIDTSGSMQNAPKKTPGISKIETARQNILRVMERALAFAREHPDRRVLIGVYEFSVREGGPNVRTVAPLEAPRPNVAVDAVKALQPRGATPIGEAMVKAKRDLNATGFTRQHILVVTDGENNHGYDPADVVRAINRLDESWRAAVYFIAFDVDAKPFAPVRDAGGLVLSAADAQELQQTLDYILAGKILVEEPHGTVTKD